MSAVIYQEPYRLPAGIMALLVHAFFFALLYLGFTWQTFPPATMQVELWQDLPDEPAAVAVKPVIEEPAVTQPPAMVEESIRLSPPPQPEQTITPDIVLPAKKKLEPKPQPVVPKPEKKKAPAKPDTRIADQKAAQEKAAQEKAAQEQAALEKAAQEKAAREQALRDQAAREQAEKDAAIGKIVDEYKAKIMAKVRRNIVMPANVPDTARAEFAVTLLPGGSVLQARLLKPSGSTAYDNAVERAILKSDPLPLPPDVALFNKFRELKLIFQPTGQ